MTCPQTRWESDGSYLNVLNEKVARMRIPMCGSIDITHRCNLNCAHCYLGDRSGSANIDSQRDTAQWKSLIDEIVEAGCLSLVITGGEPLLRKDFETLYRYSRESGLLVTLFTNGTLVTDRTIDLLRELPPFAVEVTLYGATAATYETVTGVRGSYERCIAGIERLISGNIRVRLKTILMTLNSHEFSAMQDMAKRYDVEFRSDAAIFPCFDNTLSPVELRVSPEAVVAKEFSDPETFRQWREHFERSRETFLTGPLYQCGAGLTTFHVDSSGFLKPCLMVTGLKYDLKKGSFKEGWETVIPRIREKRIAPTFECATCEKLSLCGFCPAFFKLESGSDEIPSEYLCRIGHHRFRAIKEIS
jgi:radical SAM protein with 4Fe4S-binding SPASM domain